MSNLSIRGWQEPFENPEGVAVAFDIFRCCSTIHTLFAQKKGPVLVAPSLAKVREDSRLKSYRVFSELSQPVDALERFDNSPLHAREKAWPNEAPALVATTTGTPSMFAARNFERVYVGSLLNFSSLVGHLYKLGKPVTLIPAALPDWGHVEDEITAQAMAIALEGYADMPEFLQQCLAQAKEQIIASGRPEILAKKLSTGKEDCEIAMDLDRYSQILYVDFQEENFGIVKSLGG